MVYESSCEEFDGDQIFEMRCLANNTAIFYSGDGGGDRINGENRNTYTTRAVFTRHARTPTDVANESVIFPLLYIRFEAILMVGLASDFINW